MDGVAGMAAIMPEFKTFRYKYFAARSARRP
jgi:hypothetical protein